MPQKISPQLDEAMTLLQIESELDVLDPLVWDRIERLRSQAPEDERPLFDELREAYKAQQEL